jgi:hypothetical protein
MQHVAFSRDHLAHSCAIGASLLGLGVVECAGGLANDLDCSVTRALAISILALL